MANGFDAFFGPLSKKYCYYFYILSIIGMILTIGVAFFGITAGIIKKKGISFYIALLPLIIAYGTVYFQNRLLYNMCSHTV